eukprot:gene44489-55340_t
MNKYVASIFAASAVIAGSAMAQQPTTPPFAPVTQDIKAATPKSAYVQDARGVIARDPFGLCWRTGYWTPADAVPGCDLPICVEPEKLENGNRSCTNPGTNRYASATPEVNTLYMPSEIPLTSRVRKVCRAWGRKLQVVSVAAR